MRQPETMSPNGLASLQKEEGTVLRVYKDVAGISTVCTGHVVRPEDASWIGELSWGVCRAVLGKDVRWVDDCIHRLVTITLLGYQYDALGSLIFNIGPGQGGFAGSTVLRKLNGGDYSGAADAFPLWAFATVGGVKKPVLLGRRQRERETFLTGRYPVTVDPSEWLTVRDSGLVSEVSELTEDERKVYADLLAVSIRNELWDDMDRVRREAHDDPDPTEPVG